MVVALRMRNKDLLAKGLWHFSSKPNSLWHRIIVSKHAPHPFEWLTKGIKGTYRNQWKDISKELRAFVLWVRCGVGDGKATYFWEDHWGGRDLSMGCFPVVSFVFSQKSFCC